MIALNAHCSAIEDAGGLLNMSASLACGNVRFQLRRHLLQRWIDSKVTASPNFPAD